ncbi:protein CapI [Sphingorhabdus lutea]|uniref:Protein CapI n=1 Tax=Sphingorhabdus lutea TaxID=1913578 RepID=A0A1L3JCS5_9SPHN|nr:SDR family NAD(P)-dependent oxidoreductase [Sphingorhabdus lutea]APG62957.1 protein CapI [Sphingorhabdus lutea]
MSILVTGAAGFIGFHTCLRLLNDGKNVIGIDIINDYYDPALKQARLNELTKFGEQFTFLKVDFADRHALDAALNNHKFTSIIHLGAQPGVRYSIENPHAYIESNIVGHLNMLELARHRKVTSMAYASSSSVYGENEKIPFSVDDRVDHPISLYAATKKADELMSETYAHLYGIALTGLRFFTVYGPWGRPEMAVWLFTDAIMNDRPIKIFNHGKMMRDFTYIDDIVSGIIAVAANPPKNDGSIKAGGSKACHAIYNIGNNKPEQLSTLIETIEQACGKTAEKIYMEMQAGDVPATYADIDAIQKDHGYAPTTSLDAGIPAFVNWYKSYKNIK